MRDEDHRLAAVPVIATMLVKRDGVQAAGRFCAASAVTALTLVVATAPALLARPGAVPENTVLFPLGMTRHKTPAASPLPGHLLAVTGPAGRLAALALLAAAGLAVAVSLGMRPPSHTRAATWRLAIGLTPMFALSPATRFGYLAYPAALLGWLALRGSASRQPATRPRRFPAPKVRRTTDDLVHQPP